MRTAQMIGLAVKEASNLFREIAKRPAGGQRVN